MPDAENGEGAAADARVPVIADEVLLAAVDLARGALLEVTPAQTVGSVIGHVAEGEHVLSLHFAADLSGYPGWHWSVTLARVEEAEPTVLETELLPGERALLAPEWVPWSERLADYRAAQAAAAEADAADEEDLDGDDSGDGEGADGGFDDDEADGSDDDLDAEDDAFGDDAGDDAFDGIDIDALDADGDDDSGEDDDEADEPDEADSDDADDSDVDDRAHGTD
ncbi:DUF3027 domain-containing protein [Agromyces sp. ZXT2-3]|uniref:DUF3027 domain-containing protein n=1 Tax=Agromyces sp. ZXT2-3 TaxID=3461152 RepID=UPI004054D293